MAAALWGPNGPPPLVTGGMPTWGFSWPPVDLAVSLRVRLGANEEEIIVVCGVSRSGDPNRYDVGRQRDREVRLAGRREEGRQKTQVRP